jgi:Icc-related predicted phosphoesterase
MVRLFFACDCHGSEIVWRKMLKASNYYKANVLLMCGDLTGKAAIPIIKIGSNKWECMRSADLTQAEKNMETLRSEEEVKRKMQEFRNMGYYPFETTPEEVQEISKDERKINQLINTLMRETLARWLKMIEKEIAKDVTVVVMPGNDDEYVIDDIIKENEGVVYPLEKVVQIDKYEMISCSYVNPTPWQTPRECPEKDLRKILEKEFNRVDNYETLICNFHCPPYGTNLDLGPKLDKKWRPITVAGVPVTEHVGSKSVRELILHYQPLLGLHGHIHESCGFERLGRTLCLNPGSEYQIGVLRGYVIDLHPNGKINFQRVEM